MQIPKGSIWRDRDSRVFRYVEVLGRFRSTSTGFMNVMVKNVAAPGSVKAPPRAVVSPVGRRAQIDQTSFERRFERVEGVK